MEFGMNERSGKWNWVGRGGGKGLGNGARSVGPVQLLCVARRAARRLAVFNAIAAQTSVHGSSAMHAVVKA